MNKQIPVFDINGKELEKIGMDFQSPKEDVAKQYSQAIRVLLQNWRQGTVACKNRSEVSFSRKKPWKQKGTGRARAGSARSPLWRKGGVVFGPQPRTRELDINKKQKRIVFNSILSNFLKEETKKGLYCLDINLQESTSSKTKVASKLIKDLGLDTKKIILFLPFNDEANFLAFRNISNVNVFCFDQPNAFDLSNGDYLLFLKKDMDSFKKMVSLWS
jgi:large subunit ribosomal protein L4